MVDAGLPTSISHGRYSVQKVLGEGGSAFVYKALDTALDREVAIKVLKAESTQTVTNSRFFREAQLAARLVHPNIIAIYDVGTENGHSFIAMELVEGSDLKSLIQSRPPGGLPLPEVLVIARQVCGALEYAHARGVFHCDIKPENVMLARDGTVKLADFGLARALDRPRVSSREGPVGTPSYVAPEILRGLGQDARSDLYSFGAVIYEMMTGRPPFVGKTTGPSRRVRSATIRYLRPRSSRAPPMSSRRWCSVCWRSNPNLDTTPPRTCSLRSRKFQGGSR